MNLIEKLVLFINYNEWGLPRTRCSPINAGMALKDLLSKYQTR